MFLKEIELTDFKCHKHLKLSFFTNDSRHPIRKTTFLLGENGTGKSALLKAIALITAGSSALGDVIGVPDNWIQNGKKTCRIDAVIVTADGKERKLSLTIKRNSHLADIISANRQSLALIDNAIKKGGRRNYFTVAYGASRRLNREAKGFASITSKSNNPRSGAIQSLFNPDAALISLTAWAMDLDYSNDRGGLSTVRNALNQFFVENVNFKDIDRRAAQLLFETPDGIVPLEQLSDGYQNVAAWVGDLMFNITDTFSDYNDPLHARGLLLIDEIDLHLHPRWQRKLHAFLKEKLPNFQVVATTHSPLTAQQAEEGELYALTRDQKKVDIIPFVGSPSSMLVHQILMSPVFGIPSDESLKVENTKSEIRDVSLSDKPENEKKKTIQSLEKNLEDTTVNFRSNSLIQEEDLKLLNSINQQLTTKRKK